MEARDEQEALAAIFDEDYESTAGSYTLRLRPYSTPYHNSLLFRIQYVSGYPSVAPIATCIVEKGLTDKQLAEVENLVRGAVQVD
jgi:hypothetical protein